ncbi:Metabotropic glutamate receptor 7 (mGluR7) [Durusdinium trenchii]|uniref:Metabotropic glutamate receptor 7 (MGluR7) n=2 Tax=Durusdinium trenchii TaxID=1381693 RepID=A0ABP0NK52_9DINO
MGLAAMTMRAALLASLVIALTGGQDIPLGVYGPVTTRSQLYLALVASFDLDLRKNFEPALRSRLGDPIIQITDLQPELANIKVRIGNSAGTPETGVATALDFMLGLDGEPPIVGLVGGVFSSISMPIASVAAVQKVTQISYGSTSPALSNKDTYPYFLRTVPPDSIQGQAFWNWIVAFEVPMAVCLYAVEPYGQGLFLAIEEQAKAAGQEGRLKGVSVRYMPNTFVVAEATESCRIAKSLGSRFIFVSMNSQMSNEFVVVLRDEGMLQSGWQVLGSEAFTPYGPTIFEADLPVGVMRWNPVSRGTKFANFTNLWSQLTVNDVMSADARSRYKYDNFKVPLSSATVPAVTDANFANGDLPSYDSFLFDACYTFVVAINELLKSGVAVADIKQQTLLDQVKITQFEGISGPVSFNANGDRLASYELLNQHPDGSGGTTLVQAGMFSATTGVLTIPGGQLYWMDGQIWPKPPDVLTNCDAGFYKEETSGQCKACPRGFQCAGGALPYQQCSRGYFANITGMVECLPCAEGFFAAEVGSAECSPCLAGFYMDITGQEACKKCPKGTYMPDKQAIQCIPCSMGQGTEESGAQSMSECRCAEGSFLCNSSGFTAGCQACPDGLQCAAGLDPPTQQPGFWTSGGDTCSFDVIRCRDQLECPGQAMGDCAQGREGIACNNCVEGYYPLDDGTCLPCGPGDSLPAIFTGIAAVIIIIFLLSSVNADLNQQSLNLLTVAAVGSQMVMAVQALGSIRQLSIQWVDPVREIIEFTRLLTFDFDIIRISCITGQDSPTLKFLGQLLACPMGACVIVVAYFVAKMRGRKMSLDAVFNLNGILLFALFITLTLAVLGPFQCLANPDGSSSMAANPGVLCFDSGEHTGLVILSILGIIFYPFTILTWATYTTVKYPSRINSGRGLQLVNRYRFLFQRFKPECYYYGLVLLWRNAFVALFPVLFVAVPEVQVVLMGALFVCGGALQVRVWPWRTEQANYADLVMTSLLQVVLLGAAPLLEIDEANSTEILGWLLCVAVLGPFLAGIGAICYSIWRHFQPSNVFGMFLCHHKGGAGSLCRLIKLLISRHSNCNVFLDSDQLEDLDLIFDTIRANTKSVVIVLTPELLKRMWCAGEIVTAFKNKVTTVPLICDGFVPLTAETLEAIPDVWTAQQKQILANYGITMDDVKQAYVWVRDELSPLTLSRFGPQQQREDVVVEIVQRAKVAMKVFRSNAPTGGKVKARILITGSVTDAEALATLEVFQILVQNHLRVECAMVRSSKELLAHKPYAHYFVVLFSRGMLRDPRFAQILLSTGAGKEVEEGAEEKHLEIVTVSADTGFEFPSAEFYKELEMQGLGEGLGPESGPTLAKAYRALLNVLALPLSPLGSEGLLEKQVSEISRRFRRYKDPASAIAMDNEEDLKHGGDGVDTRALGAELAKEQKEVAAAVSTMTGTMKQDDTASDIVVSSADF